ncbi:hypothetical protein VP01_347g2 [Puccinia sorghi]|uniref:Uncharacterized protein n=1 Tax=Puccinia sorghi TaxID=27349 RepID=A0A0L6UWR9_9BASI|nr:hypothetical protein VP01_347g2 [Puccinia sorghi]
MLLKSTRYSTKHLLIHFNTRHSTNESSTFVESKANLLFKLQLSRKGTSKFTQLKNQLASLISTRNNPSLSLNQILGYLNGSINCLAGLPQSTIHPCLYFHLSFLLCFDPLLSSASSSSLYTPFAYISSCTSLILFSFPQLINIPNPPLVRWVGCMRETKEIISRAFVGAVIRQFWALEWASEVGQADESCCRGNTDWAWESEEFGISQWGLDTGLNRRSRTGVKLQITPGRRGILTVLSKFSAVNPKITQYKRREKLQSISCTVFISTTLFKFLSPCSRAILDKQKKEEYTHILSQFMKHMGFVSVFAEVFFFFFDSGYYLDRNNKYKKHDIKIQGFTFPG